MVIGLDDVKVRVDVVLDNVGGQHLVTAWNLLKPGGILQSIGWASGEPAVFPPNSIFAHGPAKTIESFGDASHPGPDLSTLVNLAASGAIAVRWGGAVRGPASATRSPRCWVDVSTGRLLSTSTRRGRDGTHVNQLLVAFRSEGVLGACLACRWLSDAVEPFAE